MPDDPLDLGTIEWTSSRYRELEDDELFWLDRNKDPKNLAYRKIDDRTAYSAALGQHYEVQPERIVYQKDY